jgi:hypothetical protein
MNFLVFDPFSITTITFVRRKEGISDLIRKMSPVLDMISLASITKHRTSSCWNTGIRVTSYHIGLYPRCAPSCPEACTTVFS